MEFIGRKLEQLINAIPVPDPEVADRWIGYVCLFGLGFVTSMLVFGN
jgi:hypothetical protein